MGSMIMPSGGKRYEWIPEVPGAEKQEKIGLDAISDKELMKLAQFGEVVDVELEEPGESPEEEDVVEVSIDGEELGEELEGEGEELEEEGEGDSISELIEAVEEVKEKLDEVVEEASEVAGGEVEELEGEVEELEELDGDLEGDVVEEIAEEGALESVTPGELEEEECETCEYCGSAKGMSSVAGDSRKFTKIASVSPENKKQIAKYWKDYLGYDPEYVDWMLKDYEK